MKRRVMLWLFVGIAALAGALWFATAAWPRSYPLAERHRIAQGVAGLVLVICLLVLQLRARRGR